MDLSKKEIVYFGLPIFLFILILLGLSGGSNNTLTTDPIPPKVIEDSAKEVLKEVPEEAVEEIIDTVEGIAEETPNEEETNISPPPVIEEEPEETAPPPPPPVSDGHTWYVSSHYSSKFYYCDTDPGWQGLSERYLESYPSEAALIADYPYHTLHEPCN